MEKLSYEEVMRVLKEEWWNTEKHEQGFVLRLFNTVRRNKSELENINFLDRNDVIQLAKYRNIGEGLLTRLNDILVKNGYKPNWTPNDVGKICRNCWRF